MPATNLKLKVALEKPPIHWHCALTIPIADLGTFCCCLLKWVQYLGYTIVGVHGELSKNTAGDPTVNYDTDAKSEDLGGEYFYIADGTHMQPMPNK